MARFVLSPAAHEDIRRIRDYVEGQSGRQLARHVLQCLTEAFGLLADNPEIGHRRGDLTALPVKFWSVFSYLIVYDPAARPLTVIRVLHGRRDVGSILNRGSPLV